MRLVVRPLSVALHLVLGTTLAGSNALAQTIAPPTPAIPDNTTFQDDSTLPVIRVSALALGEETNKIAAPFSIVDRDQALQGGQSTLGDILNGLPGVHSDNFGGGASRPVIRGQSAPRTKVLSDGSAVIDASDISPDHATTVDPLLARRIEVLRGPATLLYGGGAIGGVVNVLDNKIPSAMPEGGIAASLVVRGNTVARERAAAVEMTAQLSSHLAFHIESSSRSAADYRVPDWTESHVDGSFAESANSSAGLSWITPNGHVGLAFSLRNDNYGLPGHAHEYENCHPHGSSLHCDGDDHEGHDHGDEDDHEDAPKVDLISKRFDLRGEYRDPFAGASRIRFRASHTDYRHDEIDAGEIATTFRNKGHEERIEIEHVPLGNWTGVVGIQHADTTFSADGAEAFMPTSQTRSTGVFAVEHYHLNDAWHFELGARHEWQKIEAINDPRMRPKLADTTTALSAAAIWEFVPNYTLSLSTARSERLPQAQELYARGVHLATNTYECGLLPSSFTCGGVDNDATVKKETSTNVELSLRKTMGDVMFNVAGFVNAVDNYIYARTLDQYEDFRLIKYSQRDAKFIGFEGEATWQFSNIFSATFFGDRVNARFDDGGGNLPRIPARRVGARLQGDWQAWSGELELYRVASQDHIADYETRSPSYRMLNLGLSYQLDEDGKRSVFVRANNLLNEQVWNHSSFLASVIPLPGRNVSAGFKLAF
ncbi:MAG: TonB-dependent receptor [Dokdonella sp.]